MTRTEELPRNDRPNVLFVNHAGARNRGCEAILRSLDRYLQMHLGAYNLTVFTSNLRNDLKAYADLPHLHSVQMPSYPRSSPRGFAIRLLSKLHREPAAMALRYRSLLPYYRWSDAVVEIGGDEFSMDYGGPWSPLEQVRLGKAAGRPTVVEGASIGPFEGEGITAHARDVLSSLDAVCARETITFDYLKDLGLTNVVLVADPAFLMEPEPVQVEFPSGRPVVGIGPSSGFPTYLNMSRSQYISDTAAMVDQVASRCDASILLLPHVFGEAEGQDDFSTAQEIARQAQGADRLILLPHRRYNTRQLKYLVSRCDVFAGARTHSTIAGLSTRVPTLTFTYSRKSKGIFNDFYGHSDYVLAPQAIADGTAAERIIGVFNQRVPVRESMGASLERMLERSRLNGDTVVNAVQKGFASRR